MPKKGYKQTMEHRKKHSEATRGKKHPMFSKQCSEEVRQNMSKAKKKQFDEGYIVWNKGKTGIYSEETLEMMSKAQKGKQPWNKGLRGAETSNWRGGYHFDGIHGWGKYGDDYGEQRNLARERDDYACFCGLEENGSVHDTHHIVPYRISKDNSQDNLWTLCEKCHVKIETLIVDEIMEVEKWT